MAAASAVEQAHGYGSGDLARMFDQPAHRIPIALDALGATRVPRIGRYRLLPASMLEEFKAELRRRGWWDDHDEGCPQAE
jgi:hypothetical protein